MLNHITIIFQLFLIYIFMKMYSKFGCFEYNNILYFNS